MGWVFVKHGWEIREMEDFPLPCVIPKGYRSREMMIQGTHPHVLSLLLSAYPIFLGLPI